MSGKTLGWLAIVLLVIVGGFLVFNQNKGQTPKQGETVPTAAEEATIEDEEDSDSEEAIDEMTVDYTETGFAPQNLLATP